MAQGRDEGAELVTLRAIVEEAGELDAGRALARLGLADPAAAKDMAELRDLLAAWTVRQANSDRGGAPDRHAGAFVIDATQHLRRKE